MVAAALAYECTVLQKSTLWYTKHRLPFFEAQKCTKSKLPQIFHDYVFITYRSVLIQQALLNELYCCFVPLQAALSEPTKAHRPQSCIMH